MSNSTVQKSDETKTPYSTPKLSEYATPTLSELGSVEDLTLKSKASA